MLLGLLHRRAAAGFTTGQTPFLGHSAGQGHMHTHRSELVTPALPSSHAQALSFGGEQQGQAGGCPWAGTTGAGSLQLQELW